MPWIFMLLIIPDNTHVLQTLYLAPFCFFEITTEPYKLYNVETPQFDALISDTYLPLWVVVVAIYVLIVVFPAFHIFKRYREPP